MKRNKKSTEKSQILTQSKTMIVSNENFIFKFFRKAKLIRHGSSCILFIIIFTYIFNFLYKIKDFYTNPFRPLFYPTNILTSLLNLDGFWRIVVLILNFILIYIILRSIFSKNRKIRNVALFIIFILYSYQILRFAYSEFKGFFQLPGGVSFGGNNFLLLSFSILSYILISLIVLTIMSKKISIRYIFIKSIMFLFTLAQVILGLFISLIFLRWELKEGAIFLDVVGWWILIILTGFFFFLMLEVFKEYLLEKYKI